MAKTSKYFKQPHINLAKQLLNVQQSYGSLITSHNISMNALEIRLAIRPNEDSRVYTIRIIMRDSKAPEVYITDPQIYEENKVAPPHVYNFKQGRICLHLHCEWNCSTYLSRVVPWISEWLFFYEIWRITGTWMGRGHTIEKKDE